MVGGQSADQWSEQLSVGISHKEKPLPENLKLNLRGLVETESFFGMKLNNDSTH